MQLDTRGKLFLTLAALFTTSLVVGDIIGGKLMGVPFFGSVQLLSVGFIPFPITFLLTDLLNEFYGKAAARTVTLVGLGMALFTLLLLTLAVAAPWHPVTQATDWKGLTPGPYDAVFASGTRILVASMVAYLFAQLLDIAIFHRLKTLTAGRMLWLRATGSTVVSQLLDTVVIQSLVWNDTLDVTKLSGLIIASWLGKLIIAVLLTPMIYAGHAVVERLLGIAPLPHDAG
ncbi:MAG: preQ0 transporter [Archangium gephyra]|uniref:Probable queuosine precursor transporter n=1 Tax=Archangium gephyra TaxID=48 RepID=A0A2W5U5W2_9BACT|nr:MAG: preQ0 transporter [Archangium gephyra]